MCATASAATTFFDFFVLLDLGAANRHFPPGNAILRWIG